MLVEPMGTCGKHGPVHALCSTGAKVADVALVKWPLQTVTYSLQTNRRASHINHWHHVACRVSWTVYWQVPCCHAHQAQQAAFPPLAVAF
jgi:hypothetical protein